MHSLRLAAISLWAFALSAVANPDAIQIVSSRDLNGPATKTAPATLQRVQIDETCSGRLEVGAAEFLEPEGLDTVRLPIHNLSEAPLKVRISTSFIKSDGAIMENPYASSKGGFEGMTRGFLGVLSLGASEMAMVNEACDATIITSHVLPARQKLIVEHQLPFVCDQVVGSRSHVSVVTESVQTEQAKEVRRVMKEQYWKVRDTYFQERLAETRRWEDLRNRLDQERAALEPVSEAYRKAMDAYWKAHQTHQATLEALESKFVSFARTQEETLRTVLLGEQP